MENHREGKRTVQRVLATLGRADELAESGGVDVLLKSLGRFATRVRVIQDYEAGRLEAGALRHIGPDLVFGRLWQDLGLDTALNRLLGDRGFEFPVERAVYLTVLHRLFESGLGRGGESLGQFGFSKDHRPDRRQMIVGAVLTEDGRPVVCGFWPGHQADVQALLPVGARVRRRFGLKRVCWVADRGMISAGTIEQLEEQKLEYILGARLRRHQEVRDLVLGCPGRYQKVADHLRVKEVWVQGRRYVVCHNAVEAAQDAADREALLAALQDKLRQGAKILVGNRGCRRFLKVEKEAVSIDPAAVKAEARFDGKYVLRTNTELPAAEVAVHYKRLLLVEQFFRAAKSLLDTRPIFHQWDATIQGHVFCSFLALVLLDELQRRLAQRGVEAEWADLRRDLLALAEVEVRDGDHWYLLRTALQGVAGKVC